MTPNPSAGNASLMRLTSVELHPTNRCNANCLFCRLHGRKLDAGELPDEWWLKLVDELCELEVAWVTISGGGEPLMRSGLVLRMMEKLTARGVGGNLLTNGMLITDEIAQQIVEMRWPSVQVGLHAASAPLNDALVDKAGAFSLALGGIRKLQEEKQRRGSELPEVSIRTVLEQSNFRKLPEIVGLAHSERLAGVVVRLANDSEIRTDKSLALASGEYSLLRDAITRAEKTAEELGVEVDFEVESKLRGPEAITSDPMKTYFYRQHCPFPFRELVVFANGMSGPCNNYFDYQFKPAHQCTGGLEDLSRHSLHEVWPNGFSSLRRSMSTDANLSQPCKTCSEDMRQRREQWPQSSWLLNLWKQKKYRKGLRFCEELLTEYPGHPVLHHSIGEFYMGLDDYKKAIEHLSRAVELNQVREETGFGLGKCYYLTGRYEDALRFLSWYVKQKGSLEENMFYSWYFMAICHHRLKQFEKMKECLAKAKEFTEHLVEEGRWPDPFFHEEFRYLKGREAYQEGIRFGTEQLKKYSDCATLHHYIGEFHMELCEYEKAIEHLSLAVKLNPTIEWSRFSLGKCYYLTNQYDKAEAPLKENIERTTERLGHYHSWLFLAMVHHATGDAKACKRDLEKLKGFRDLFGDEIALEQEFLQQLGRERLLPPWLTDTHSRRLKC